jgi:hypothetical protein
MLPTSGRSLAISPITVEFIFTIIALLLLLGWPALGSSFFSHIEGWLAAIARRRRLAVAVVGLTELLLRLAILPVCPVPNPIVPDDFSFLLSADTFAQWRLTNPTPTMWTHFESIHVTMQPTYMSMYFPAQGLILAAGKVLLGNPWFGLLMTTALMCAAICWMLQAWMPATWAFLGGMLSVIHLGLFSYWINSYHAAAIAALGGAIVLGALPRLMKSGSIRYGLLLATGIVILVLSRPYEGLLLAVPVAGMLGRWALFGTNRPEPAVLLGRAIIPVMLIAAAAAWLGYYDYRAFGSPTTLPYTVNRAQYSIAPYFIWQAQRPEPAYRHAAMRSYYRETESDIVRKSRSPLGYALVKTALAINSIMFFTGIALLPPLVMLRRILTDRRSRFLVLCILVLMVGMAIEVFLLPHYLAPFTAAFYALGLQGMRHLCLWRPGNTIAGLTLVRLSVTICVIMAGLRLFAGPLHLALPEYPPKAWNFVWYGPDHFGTERVRVLKLLSQLPGNQLAIVRYSPQHNQFNEWVYNEANIESSKVIWAREMDDANNRELIDYYKDRRAWLVEPDSLPAVVDRYPVPSQDSGHTRRTASSECTGVCANAR